MPGNQVKDWGKYHALRREGHSKQSAARITNATSMEQGGMAVVGKRGKLRPTLAIGAPFTPRPVLRIPESLTAVGDDTGRRYFRFGDNPNGPETVQVSPPAPSARGPTVAWRNSDDPNGEPYPVDAQGRATGDFISPMRMRQLPEWTGPLSMATGGTAIIGRGGGSNPADEEARRQLDQAKRMYAATGDYETQAAEARRSFLRPEVQEGYKYGALGVLTPPEVAGYTGGNPLVSGRPLTTVEQLQRTFQGEDIAAAERRLNQQQGGGGYATAAAPRSFGGGSPYVNENYLNPTPIGTSRPSGGGGGGQEPRTLRGGQASSDNAGQDEVMKSLGFVPTNYDQNGERVPVVSYVSEREASIREARNKELTKQEYERRFPKQNVRSTYGGLSEAALVKYAVDGVLSDEDLATELRSRKEDDGRPAFTEPEVAVILKAVAKEREKAKGPQITYPKGFGATDNGTFSPEDLAGLSPTALFRLFGDSLRGAIAGVR